MKPGTEHQHEHVHDSCCWECFYQQDYNRLRTIFMICSECGNKRCPKANDHDWDCSGSNEPGQAGSAYPPVVRTDAELAGAIRNFVNAYSPETDPTVEP